MTSDKLFSICEQIQKLYPHPLTPEMKSFLSGFRNTIIDLPQMSLQELFEMAISLTKKTPEMLAQFCLLWLSVFSLPVYQEHEEKDILDTWITTLLEPSSEIFPQNYTRIHSQFVREYPDTTVCPELFLLGMLSNGFLPIDDQGNFRIRCSRPLTDFQKQVLNREGNVLLLNLESELMKNKMYAEEVRLYKMFQDRAAEMPFVPLTLNDRTALYPENQERYLKKRRWNRQKICLSEFNLQKVDRTWCICENRYRLFLNMGLLDIFELDKRSN